MTYQSEGCFVPRHALLAAGLICLAELLPGAASAQQAAEELVRPEEVHSRNGELTLALTAAPAKINVAGVSFSSNVFNGKYLSPVLRVRRGDLVKIHLVNEIAKADNEISKPEPTNLHYHGMAIPPTEPADDIFVEVHPKGHEHVGHHSNVYEYAWRVPEDHALGLHWYHPHVHGRVEDQVLSGLSGLLVVESMTETHYPQFADLQRQTLILRDIDLPGAKDGDPKTKTINGQKHPAIRMRPGEFQIWEIGNLGADSYFDLELDGHSFWVLGRDGNPTELPVKEQTLYLSPGARAEVLVQSAKAGHYPLRSLKVDTGPQGDPNPQVELGTVIVEGGPVNGGSTSADLSKPAVALDSGDITAREVRKLPITNRRTITFSETADGKTFFLNNKMFDQGRIDTTVTIGDVEEWTLRNVTGERHVFHIHQTDFLVTEQEGAALDYKGLRDVIDIPQQRNGKPGEVKIIVPFLRPNIAGKFVYHCHILEHEDNGMMANIVVLPAK